MCESREDERIPNIMWPLFDAQNHYDVETHFNLDANWLVWTLNKLLHNQLKKVSKN